MVEIKITKIDCDWTEIKNECRATMGKEPTEIRASKDFVAKLLISEHSPIRLASIKWTWKGIKSWVSVHFSRHWLGWDKWISTQRSDRTGEDRDKKPQDSPVNMDIRANAQALINVSRWRLCFKSAPETREQMEDLKRAIREEGEHEIALTMQPNCVYRCGCPEFETCGYWQKLYQRFPNYADIMNIRKRYELADEQFYKRIGGENGKE